MEEGRRRIGGGEGGEGRGGSVFCCEADERH